MFIDIEDIISRKTSKKDISICVKPQDIFKNESEVRAKNDLNFSGELYAASETINLEGKLSGDLMLTCSRCLEEFPYHLDLEIQEKFSLVPNNEDDSTIFIDSDKINFIYIFETNILMSLPMKKLCSDDCKGLCQHCGTNLNHRTCNCNSENIDPRLSKLKDMFFTD
ncbi:YceD family protein [Clostridium oryzae]|uniref:Large ribosomal RNA subunit accumulation protein YceD n=1 Tax=Clostridium oryzae TaxID=1450648 RepID=A0A1V4IPN0_9CLOT|nr:DUF177 domain-containing protein [Clostridium oryzae]OPJ61774.1 hypothetical protein CLORY_20800 [Clostridium oryzae]